MHQLSDDLRGTQAVARRCRWHKRARAGPGGINGQSLIGWLPNGSGLLYAENGKMYVIDASGSEPQSVDTGCTDPCQFDSDASFSADGHRLVFDRAQDGTYGVATMDLATGQVGLLTSTGSSRETLLPGWSPDGTQIVFWRPGDKDFGSGPITPVKSAVFIVDADGQNVHQISPVGLSAESPRRSPDGGRIVFASTDAHGTDVYTMRPDGTAVSRLTADGASEDPSWTPDGRILFDRNSSGPDSGLPPVSGPWTLTVRTPPSSCREPLPRPTAADCGNQSEARRSCHRRGSPQPDRKSVLPRRLP